MELPKAAAYALTGNGKALVLGENDELPELTSVTVEGTAEVAPAGCTFIVV